MTIYFILIIICLIILIWQINQLCLILQRIFEYTFRKQLDEEVKEEGVKLEFSGDDKPEENFFDNFKK